MDKHEVVMEKFSTGLELFERGADIEEMLARARVGYAVLQYAKDAGPHSVERLDFALMELNKILARKKIPMVHYMSMVSYAIGMRGNPAYADYFLESFRQQSNLSLQLLEAELAQIVRLPQA